MSGSLSIRLTGQDEVIRAIYNRIREASPRGPRGGYLYRCSLKERDNGIMQLYADLPASVLGGLFADGVPAASAEIQPPLLPLAPAVVKGDEPSRLSIDFRRK